MAVTNYLSVNGQLIGEVTGGVRTDYLTDALGSVTGTVDSSANVVNTYRYKPYGALLAKTGVGADPMFLWTGATPSRVTGRLTADQYNVFRHLSKENGGWNSRDIFWSVQLPYSYASLNPVCRTDSMGTTSCIQGMRGWSALDGLQQWTENLYSARDCSTGVIMTEEAGLASCNFPLSPAKWMPIPAALMPGPVGKMAIWLCDDPCTIECTCRHERQHASDRRQCCALASAFVQQPWISLAQRSAAAQGFQRWRKNNTSITEYRAWNESITCATELLRTSSNEACQGKLFTYMLIADDAVRRYENGKGKEVSPCPFFGIPRSGIIYVDKLAGEP